jgi:hypothetical protein
MPPKRNREQRVTPPWVDTLITWLEFIGVIGVILSGIYALVTLVWG